MPNALFDRLALHFQLEYAQTCQHPKPWQAKIVISWIDIAPTWALTPHKNWDALRPVSFLYVLCYVTQIP